MKEELSKRINWFQQKDNQSNIHYKFDLDLYVSNKNLAQHKVSVDYLEGRIPNFELVIHNTSLRTYQVGEFQVGVICEDYNRPVGNSSVVVTPLPDGRYLHMLPYFDQLFPDSYSNTTIFLDYFHEERRDMKRNFEATIRVYTDVGTRDFQINLKSV